MLKEFYGDILPEEGCYCLTLLPQGEHVWADSLDELVYITEQRIDRSGLYFGTAAFQSFANRKQTNVLGLKALRLDIDAGPEKFAKHGGEGVYETQKDALAACLGFFRETELMPSYVVSSGAGLHVYYCLTEAIDPADWLRLAKGLSALGEKHNLLIDPSVTQDSARILRVPGAPHPNGKRVSILRRTGVVHSPEALRKSLGLMEAPRKFDMSINEDLDLSYQGPPSSAEKIVEHCAALAHVAGVQGNVPEPYWRAMIGLVKRTVEGLEIAQEWSSGHPDYDPSEVENKFHAWTTGPTTCMEFSKHTKACQSCPHRGKVKSPIALGLMTTTEIQTLPEEEQVVLATPPAPEPTGKPWDGHIPAGFSVEFGKSGQAYLVMHTMVEKESATGEMVPTAVQIPFTHTVFWLSQWAEAEDTDDNAQVIITLWTGKYLKRYTMDQSLVASTTKLTEFLSGKAIHTTSHKKAAQAMQDYVKAQLQHIRDDRKNLKVTDHMGLRTLESGELVCTQGKYTIFPDGSIRETMLSGQLRALARAFTIPLPNNTQEIFGPEIWDEFIIPRASKHVEFIKRYYNQAGMERFQLAIMLSMASPLMAFVTGEYAGGAQLPNNSSLTVSLFSRETARGKTTAAQTAIMAYGLPGVLSNDSGKAGASVNARIGTLSLHGTLPSIMDEMGDLLPAEVATTVSSVANGAGKRTFTQSRMLRQEATWSLINIITTNVSQRDMVAAARSAAGPVLYRMLEIDVDGMPEYDQERIAAFREDWADMNRTCAGALGAVIHREICALGLSNMVKLVTKCVDRAEKLVGAKQSDRFQSRGLGAMLALDLILRNAKLSFFDISKLVAEFKVAHDANVNYVIENTLSDNPLEILNQFLLDIASDTIVTQEESHGGFRQAVDRPLNVKLPDKPKARHILGKGVSYVSVDALKKWCADKSIAERPIIVAARKEEVLMTFERNVQMGGTTRKIGRSSELKSLTKGLLGDMKISCKVYTFNVRKLNAILRTEDNGFELVSGAGQPELEETGT